MWWAEGFPSHSPLAAWHRCVQTGYYGFVFDTETMQFVHFGPFATPTETDLSKLPSVRLELRVVTGGKTYKCIRGGKWSKYGGPRLIESGRFLQRADVTDLEFASDDGEKLEINTRFETVAWPKQLGMIFAAKCEKSARLEIELHDIKGTRSNAIEVNLKDQPTDREAKSLWHEVSLVIDPLNFHAPPPPCKLRILANDVSNGNDQPIQFEASRGWHRINLDSTEVVLPKKLLDGLPSDRNNAMERIKIVLSNPSDWEQTANLLFEKTARGFKHQLGASVTGISAVLRDSNGQPTGIPVQLSKNWHNDAQAGAYRGQWFHGITQVKVAPHGQIELELSIVYGHWGGVAAASHAQLCLIGWGSNQLWNQTALGAWGENICYEPDQVQANCTMTDVRPLMVRSMNSGEPWGWTSNVGGGDWFRWFDQDAKRVPHTAMKSIDHRQGPCLTEVTYAGHLGDSINHATTVSLVRTDDLVRATYRLRMDVNKATDFSRFVIFQFGADTYSYTGEKKMAMGNEEGLQKEWETQWGGGLYRTEPMRCVGRVPWVSLHEAVPQLKDQQRGAWANRGIVIRSWTAKLGGKESSPWIAERGVNVHGKETSTLDLVLPPNVKKLLPGDFVDGTIEFVVMPQFADDYYGPNESLRTALRQHQNTWRMIHREAVENDRQITMKIGKLQHRFPDIRIEATNNQAEFEIEGGTGYVPITFTGLTAPARYELYVGGKRLDQSVHGNDFWQTDYDPTTQRWSQTFNVPASFKAGRTIHFYQANN